MTLHIGITMPDRTLEKSQIENAVIHLAERVAFVKRRGSFPKGSTLDVTFMLSSPEDRPGFKGMRMGGYTQEEDTLFFQAVVPHQLSHSNQATRYVSLVLQDVVDNADDFFRENALCFDASQWRTVLQGIAPDT
jgi:hypothetical protein